MSQLHMGKGYALNELPDYWGSFSLHGDAQKVPWLPATGAPSMFCPELDARTLHFPGPVQLLCVSSTNAAHYPASGLDPTHAVNKKKKKKNEPHNI